MNSYPRRPSEPLLTWRDICRYICRQQVYVVVVFTFYCLCLMLIVWHSEPTSFPALSSDLAPAKLLKSSSHSSDTAPKLPPISKQHPKISNASEETVPIEISDSTKPKVLHSHVRFVNLKKRWRPGQVLTTFSPSENTMDGDNKISISTSTGQPDPLPLLQLPQLVKNYLWPPSANPLVLPPTVTPHKTIQDDLSPSKSNTVNAIRLIMTNFIINNQSICGPPIQNWKDPLKNIHSISTSQPTSEEFTQRSPSNKSLAIILVHSARPNFIARETIRKTYGTIKQYKNWEVRLVFLLGKRDRSQKPKANEPMMSEHIRLAWEVETYGDIILGNFTDTYRTLSYKHIMGYRWVRRFCSEAQYAIKVDDDHFVDILEILDSAIPKMVRENATFYCSKRTSQHVERKKSNWHISVEEYPKAKYPDYCAGGGYIVSVDGIRKLFPMARRLPFLSISDAYVTGVLRQGYEDQNRGEDKLTILHQEHIENHEKDQCRYDRKENTYWSSINRLAFRAIWNKDNYVNLMWCWWKEALEHKKILKAQVKRFIISSFFV